MLENAGAFELGLLIGLAEKTPAVVKSFSLYEDRPRDLESFELERYKILLFSKRSGLTFDTRIPETAMALSSYGSFRFGQV